MRVYPLYTSVNPGKGINMSLNPTHTDVSPNEHLADLIGSIATNQSRGAFAEVFEHFAPRLKSYLIRLGSIDNEAEEITQEVMLTVWRKAAQYDRRQASVSTWIFRIARNRRIDVHRRTNKPALDAEDPMLQPAPSEQPDVTVNRKQVDAQVREAIETLPEDQLMLLRAAFYEGLTHSQISKTYGIPLGTVKSRIRLAFKRLKGDLESD